MMGMHLLLWVHSERAGGGYALVGEHEPQNAVPGGPLGYLKCGSVPARALGDADGPRHPPPRRTSGRRPGRELQEFRRPRGTRAAGPDEVAVGRMGHVDHRPRRDHEPVGAVGADRGAQAVRGGQTAQLADELGALIGDQPVPAVRTKGS
jgi:hypothetical protein